MSLDTKPNLDKSKFEQLEGDILNLSGCTNIYGCLDVKKSGVINSNNGYDISGITQIRLGEDITAIAIGSDAYSKCCNSIAIGYCSSATTRCAISIGALSQVISYNSIAIGALSQVISYNSIAIGNSSIVCGQQSVAIGSYSKTYKLSSVAVGDSSRSNTLYGVSIGANAGSCYDNYFQTVVGGYAGGNSITCDITALGYLAELSSSGSTHIGIGSLAGVTSCGCSTIMIGTNAGYNSCGDLNIFIGHGVGCENTDSGKFILGNCYYELGCYVLICGDFFTGNVTIPKLSGLTSSAVGVDCNGTLMRISQPSGGISWVGNTVGGVGTYVNNTTICSQPKFIYDINGLHVTGKTYFNGLTNSVKNNAIYYDSITNEITYGTTAHTHTKSQITDFAHTHLTSDITDLQTSLDGKVSKSGDTMTGVLVVDDYAEISSPTGLIAGRDAVLRAIEGTYRTEIRAQDASNVDDLGIRVRHSTNAGSGWTTVFQATQNEGYFFLKGSATQTFKYLGTQGSDYVKTVILLHPIYDGTLIDNNFVNGEIFATRGSTSSSNIKRLCKIFSSSAYNGIYATIESYDTSRWVLKTCTYNSTKYLCVEIPYTGPYLTYLYFSGMYLSTGEKLKIVNYYNVNTSTVLNSEVYNSLQDYTPNMNKYFEVQNLYVNNEAVALSSQLDDKVSKAGDEMTGALGWSNDVGNGSRVYKKVYSKSLDTTYTGTVKITLPKGWTSTMMRIRVIGYDFSGYGAWEVILGGYNYGIGQSWHNTYAETRGSAPFSRVRFGYDGSKCCILLGETNTSWSYPSFVIDEVLVYFSSQYVTGWDSGWSVDIITDESGISSVVEPTLRKVWNSANDGSGSGLDADKLDGLDSSSFATASHTHTIGNITNLQTTLDGKVSKSGDIIDGSYTIRSTDSTTAILSVGMSSNGTQGSGAVEVTQDGSYGGGMSYNGDGSPAFVTGEGADRITFYRMCAGARCEVFSYAHNSSVVKFASTPTVGSTPLALYNQTMYIGTTAVAINRGSGSLSLAGVSIDGNAGTATQLATSRLINGTSFNGAGDITTACWGTARSITIGNCAKSVNGSANVSWSLTEIGATPYASNSQTVSANNGGKWYRIATSAIGVGRNSAIFEVEFTVSDLHSRVSFRASNHYNAGNSISIEKLGGSTYSLPNPISEVRVLYKNNVYSNEYGYVDVFVKNTDVSTAGTLYAKMINSIGWVLTTGENVTIPATYNNLNLRLDNNNPFYNTSQIKTPLMPSSGVLNIDLRQRQQFISTIITQNTTINISNLYDGATGAILLTLTGNYTITLGTMTNEAGTTLTKFSSGTFTSLASGYYLLYYKLFPDYYNNYYVFFNMSNKYTQL